MPLQSGTDRRTDLRDDRECQIGIQGSVGLDHLIKGSTIRPLADDRDTRGVHVIGRQVQYIENTQQSAIIDPRGGTCCAEHGDGPWIIGVEHADRNGSIQDRVACQPQGAVGIHPSDLFDEVVPIESTQGAARRWSLVRASASASVISRIRRMRAAMR